jgi:hypothetical protein
MHISESRLSRILNKPDLIRIDEVEGLASYFGVPQEELMDVTNPKRTQISEYGLSNPSLERLKGYCKDAEFAAAINIILSNKNITESLLRILLLYVKDPMFKLSPLTSSDQNDVILFNSSVNHIVSTSILTGLLIKFVDAFKFEWDMYMKSDIDAILKLVKDKDTAERFISKAKNLAANTNFTNEYRLILCALDIYPQLNDPGTISDD